MTAANLNALDAKYSPCCYGIDQTGLCSCTWRSGGSKERHAGLVTSAHCLKSRIEELYILMSKGSPHSLSFHTADTSHIQMQIIFSLAVVALATTILAQGPVFFGTCYRGPGCVGPGQTIFVFPGDPAGVSSCQSFEAAFSSYACKTDCDQNCDAVDGGRCANNGPYVCVKRK